MYLLYTLFFTYAVATDPIKDAATAASGTSPENVKKFMPNPTGHGFDDKGLTQDPGFDSAAQMERFGIPDLSNPVTKELTDLDFEYAIKESDWLAVMFYSHKMEEYEYFALHWEKASMEMGEAMSVYTTANITMARFDISEPEHADIVAQYNIPDKSPSLKLFHQGKVWTDIRCPIVHHEIRQFIVAQTIPSVSELTEEKELRKWKRRKQVNQANLKFLAYFPQDQTVQNNERMKEFYNIATNLRQKVQFARVLDSKLYAMITKLDEASVQSGDIMFLRDFNEPKQIPYTDALSLPDLIKFLREHNMPLLTNMADKDEYKVRDFLSHPLEYRLLIFFKTPEKFRKYESQLEELAKEIRHEALIAYTVDNQEEGGNFDYQFWEVPGKEPAFLYLQIHKDRKFIYTGKDAHEIATIKNYIAKVKAGKIEPKLKSQVEPAQNNGPVKVLTTNSYAREVYEAIDQDTLVLFYMPGQRDSEWYLDHLSKFSKVWRREKRLYIGGVDCAQNDIISANVTHYPTLFYVPSLSKMNRSPVTNITMPIRYPDMEQLLQFVQNSTDLDLKLDEKVWNRIAEEDQKLKEEIKKRNEEIMNAIDEQAEDLKVMEEAMNTAKEQVKAEEGEEGDFQLPGGDALFGAKFQELKKKVLAETKENMEGDAETKEFDGTAIDKNIFPGNLGEVKRAQSIIKGEINSLLKSTGFQVPDDLNEKLDKEKVLEQAKWYSTLLFMLNLFMVSVFGSGVMGGVVVLGSLFTVFFGIPFLRRRYRRRQMANWLRAYYQENVPDHINRVDIIVDAYFTLNNGFEKLKDDIIRKYTLNQETKKTK